jgi:hypothetical protein
VGLFNAIEESGHAKKRRRVIIAVVAVLFIAGGLWWALRYHTERVTILHFMTAVVAGNMQQAYQIWKPSPSYSFKDFQDDWGPSGYYGPVRSFNVKDSSKPRFGSAVEVEIEISPYQPFPPQDDMLKQSKTKAVKLWVETKDQSISFPPY